jgi:hypothetical protein
MGCRVYRANDATAAAPRKIAEKINVTLSVMWLLREARKKRSSALQAMNK